FSADRSHRPSRLPPFPTRRSSDLEKPKRSRELRRLENIRRDPRVTVLAHHYEADWSKLWWVRAEGTATVREVPPDTAENSLRGQIRKSTRLNSSHVKISYAVFCLK